MTARNVIANIAGGQYREISNQSEWLTLDGSQSREPGQSGSASQQLTYTWTVRSSSEPNEVDISVENSGKYALKIDLTGESLMPL